MVSHVLELVTCFDIVDCVLKLGYSTCFELEEWAMKRYKKSSHNSKKTRKVDATYNFTSLKWKKSVAQVHELCIIWGNRP